jgi:hypothetical protein
MAVALDLDLDLDLRSDSGSVSSRTASIITSGPALLGRR